MQTTQTSQLLRRAAQQVPDKLAAVFTDRTLSFAELDDASSKAATRMQAAGLGPGHRVAVVAKTAPSALIYYWAIAKAGATVLDVPHWLGATSVAKVLREAEATAVVGDAATLRKQVESAVEPLLPQLVFTETEAVDFMDATGRHSHGLSEILATETPLAQDVGVDENSVAQVIYTSGSTGAPTGVMLSHRNLLRNIEASNELTGLTEDDSLLLVVPLHFIHGRMQLLFHMHLGSTVHFSEGFQFPQRVVEELVRSDVTGFSGVPFHFRQLLKRSKISKTPLPRLRYMLVTGGALHPEELRKLADAVPGAKIHIGYGQTEAAPRISFLRGDEVFERAGSAGRVLPGVKVDLLDPAGDPVERGAIGRVIVSGPNVMVGYVNGGERTLGIIDDLDRLHTGDLGRFDDDGYLYLEGRSSEMIKTAGERVFPGEVEATIARLDGVREVAVIGLPEKTLGEKMVACVVLDPGHELDLSTLRQHCLAHLPFVRVPRELHVLAELPHTDSGKISRSRLKTSLLEAAAAQST